MNMVWERAYDHREASERWRRFVRPFVLITLVVGVIVLISSGPAGLLGVVIVAGLTGALGAGYVASKSAYLRVGRQLNRDGDDLVLGSGIRVPIGDVAHWTTFILTPEEQARGRNRSRSARWPLGMIRFTFMDGRTTEFSWPWLDEAELEGLRLAVAQHLPAPWMARQTD